MAIAAKDCHALISYYEKIYKAQYNKAPNVNRYAARWGFDSVLQSMNSEDAKALLDYYLTTPATRKHDLDWFFYHYHDLIDGMQKAQADAAHRRKLMEESKLRAEQWRNSGKQGITNN
jgi:uncharacterized protein YdiU (UPF0061 family)